MTGSTEFLSMEEERASLFWRQAKRAAKFGAVVYPAHIFIDYSNFGNKDWVTAAWIRIAASVLAGLVFWVAASSNWGKKHRVALITAIFFICYLGFEAIVCYEDAYGTVYEDALDLFFAVYCLLLPVRTRSALMVGISMAAISLGGEAIFKQRIPVDLGLSLFYYGIVLSIFGFGRHVINTLWEAEYKARDALRSALQDLTLTQGRLVQSERMAAIGRLTGEVAHELNNPLSLISVNISTIERDAAALPDSDKVLRRSVQESLALIQHGVDQAAGVISNLRQLGSLLRKESTISDVNAILDTAASLMKVRAERGGIQLHRAYGTLPKTWCNPQSLSQVFVNVLQNACQAAKAKGNIWVTTECVGSIIRVEVRDDGGEVDAKTLSQAFEPYFTTKENSTGIGLAISRRIVEEHGGTIKIEPDTKGAKLTIDLPVRSH